MLHPRMEVITALILLTSPAKSNRLGLREFHSASALRPPRSIFAAVGVRFGACVTNAPSSTTVRNCTRDEGGPFEAGSQVQVSSHRKLLSSRAMVVLRESAMLYER